MLITTSARTACGCIGEPQADRPAPVVQDQGDPLDPEDLK